MCKLDKKKIFYVSIVIIVAIVGYYFFIRDNDYMESNGDFNVLITEEKEKNEIISNEIDNIIENKIVVYVTGQVKNEGVYELAENSRVADGIEIAGGLTDEAELKDLNLAFLLEDGMKIYIPKKGEDVNEVKDFTDTYVSKDNVGINNSNSTSSNSQSKKVNINTATQTELESLPGIGPSTAEKIISYRKQNGKFSSVEDVKNVSGIGDNKYSKIKDFIEI